MPSLKKSFYLRLASFLKIVAWVLAVSDKHSIKPESFLWNGTDYLLKMYTDLDFVSQQLGNKAWVNGNFAEGNPLLLSNEELAGRGERKLMSRIRAASNVLCDVVLRNQENDENMAMLALPVSHNVGKTTKAVAKTSKASVPAKTAATGGSAAGPKRVATA